MADSTGFVLPSRPTGTTDTPYTNTLPGGANLPYGSLGAQLLDALGISSGHGMYQNTRYTNILNNLGNLRGWGYALPGGGLLNIAHDAASRQPYNQPMFPQSGQGGGAGMPTGAPSSPAAGGGQGYTDWASGPGGGIDPATGQPSWGSVSPQRAQPTMQTAAVQQPAAAPQASQYQLALQRMFAGLGGIR